jgi:methionyl-tRNA formyltransferase
MYKNILVFSDNLDLCQQFKSIFEKKKYATNKLDFAISSNIQKTKFIEILQHKVLLLNLKNSDNVEFILENYDLVLSIHCKQIFPPILVENVKCINVHPGYNPINRGWFPQVFSIINNLPIGATIHEIDNELDNGKIIDRGFVKKEVYDTSLTLYNKILNKEVELLKNNLDNIIFNKFITYKPENEGNLFLKKDFNELLELDLNKKTTMQECIDKLRALTHGEYPNAYFIDKESGKKIYVSIELKLDD